MNISSNKSLSRLAAVQTLFQFDFNKKMKLEELNSINDMDVSEIYQTIENINSNMEEFKNLKIDKNIRQNRKIKTQKTNRFSINIYLL